MAGRGNNPSRGNKDSRVHNDEAGRSVGRGGRGGRGGRANAPTGGRGEYSAGRGGNPDIGGQRPENGPERQGKHSGGRNNGTNNRRNNGTNNGTNEGRDSNGREQGRGGGRGRSGTENASLADSVQLEHQSVGVSGEVKTFWVRLHQHLLQRKAAFSPSSAEDCNLWKQCWIAAENGANGSDFPAMSLLQIYIALPDAESIHPAASSVVGVLNRVVIGLRDVSNISKISESAKVIDAVVSTIKTRLQSSKSLATINVGACDGLSDDVKALKKSLLQRVLRLRSIDYDSEALKCLQADIEGTIFTTFLSSIDRVKLEGATISRAEMEDHPWTAWCSTPTVGWLMSGAWHADVPPLQEYYEGGLPEYAETLLRTWTVLTFYWGSAAVWPKCKHKVPRNGKEECCDEPLLHHIDGGCGSCGERISRGGVVQHCGGEARWACHKPSHHGQAVCQRCLGKLQDILAGAGPAQAKLPPTGASTDIYNAVVTREETRSVGTVFHLAGVTSRKPPFVPPNWRTTYRLQPSALVAVVKLSVANEPLKREHQIYWAEIVQSVVPARHGPGQGHQAHESTFRQSGKMAVRLLGRGDISALHSEADLPQSTQVAVIDLRVFVPEVVSVLATFANPRFGEHMALIPFAPRLIGAESSPPLLRLLPAQTSIDHYTACAIQQSEIRCLQMLSSDAKAAVIQEILQLPPVRNLYGTQLESFANGLRSALHCTQGPPGTGKSYVGVCIILALVIVRKYVLQSGVSVGPILMLSYKNHALEEFLSDVLTFAPWLKPGQLVRCGKVELASLKDYSEFNSGAERDAEKELQRCIQTQRTARAVSKAWMELSRGQEYRTAQATDAVIRVMELLLQAMNAWCEAAEMDERDLIPGLVCANPLKLDQLSDSDAYEDVFPSWITEVDHWKEVVNRRNRGERQVLILLTHWLRGESPPPRCQTPECFNYQLKGKQYCRSHACVAAGCAEMRIADPAASYCELHNCQVAHNRCFGHRLSSGSFCADHSCASCVAHVLTGAPGATVRSVAQLGLACELHRCVEHDCLYAAVLPHQYCHLHICLFCVRLHSAGDAQLACDGDYCAEHKCELDGCTNLRLLSVDGALHCADHTCRLCCDLVDQSAPASVLCANHRCAFADPTGPCLHDAMDDIQNIALRCCAYHTCRVCSVQPDGAQWRPIVAPYPRNVCDQHPLCAFLVPDSDDLLCEECSVPNSALCPAHMYAAPPDPVQTQALLYNGVCHGVTKKGPPCKAKCHEANQLFCTAHANQAVEQAAMQAAPAVKADPHLTMRTALLETIDRAMEGLRRDEAVVTHTLCAFDLVYCDHNGCCVRGRSPVSTGGWLCALHAVPAPLAMEPPVESAEPTVDASGHEGNVSTNGPAATKGPAAGTGTKKAPTWTAVDSDGDDDYEMVAQDDGDAYARPDAVGAGQLDADEMDVDYDDNTGYDPHRPLSGVKADVPAGTVSVGAKIVGGGARATAGPGEGEGIRDDEGSVDADGEDDNDEQRRLQDIGALDEQAPSNPTDDADVESDEEEQASYGSNIEGLSHDQVVQIALDEACRWSWAWSIEQRHEAVSRLVRLMVRRLSGLRDQWDNVVASARRAKSEAGAATLKRAIIVGATVVGASRRLDTLRAAEPFAAVVEEACEVMEPTLISVLAVKSLQKLELVGDHRQLPAFVQQCWYNLETTMPSIKTSMFERLIGDIQWKKSKSRAAAPATAVTIHRVPFSVLDEQRRMRANLADLTRPHYRDVTSISDHPKTATQRMGDALRSRTGKDAKTQLRVLETHRELWHKQSEDFVPGVQSNVFFWDLPGNSESRPIAGLSACNEGEARCVVSIAMWLMLCGTPSSSITIITPYKGQKNLIIKLLRDAKLLPDHRPNPAEQQDDSAGPVTVSTVDTFQGDENDVILMSLVRCKPGNRFIELLNRFIVAVSRARLALFIVGSKDAVVKGYKEGGKGPAHWVEFVDHLQKMRTTPAGHAVCQPLVDSSFPICCPRHLSSARSVDAKQFPEHSRWGAFCKEACPARLPCTHMCGMLCHSPSEQAHTAKCPQHVKRPCDAHSTTPLLCGEVKRKVPGEPLAEALQRFECEVSVIFTRQCGHIVRMQCFEESRLVEKTHELKPCVEIVADFDLPCGHKISKPTCSDRERYQAAAPQCNVQVPHSRRGCGCIIPMRCFESVRELAGNAAVQCEHNKEVRRPRCGHLLSNKCHIVRSLWTTWNQHGTGVSAAHAANPRSKLVVPFATGYGYAERDLVPVLPHCNVKVDYKARCGHLFPNMLCCTAFELARSEERGLATCEASTATECFLCGSAGVQVPCCTLPTSRAVAAVLQFDSFSRTAEGFTIDEHEIEQFRGQIGFPLSVINIWKTLCSAKFRILRECGHHIDTSCHQVFAYLATTRRPGERVIPQCTAQTTRKLTCGHSIPIKCCESSQPEPKCTRHNTQKYVFPCGTHNTVPSTCADLLRMQAQARRGESKCIAKVSVPLYRCGHQVSVKCCDSAQASQAMVDGVKLPFADSVVDFALKYCSPCPIVKCKITVTVKLPCGHDRADVLCDDAFAWVADEFQSAPLCCERVPVQNPVCGHGIEVMCWAVKDIQSWKPWPAAGRPPVRLIQEINADGGVGTLNVIRASGNAPKALPRSITAEMVACSAAAIYQRTACDHTQRVTCSDAFWHTVGLCEAPVSKICPEVNCLFERDVMCHTKDRNEPCKNQVSKLCQTCKVNSVNVECCKQDVRCDRPVEAFLVPCKHVASWLCGSEPDPRLRGAQATNFCLPCVSPRWNRYIEQEICSFNPPQGFDWLAVLRATVASKVDSFVKIDRQMHLDAPHRPHVDARRRIASAVRDTLHAHPKTAVESPPQVAFLSAAELRSDSYTWVLSRINNAKDQPTAPFEAMVPTVFGAGVELEILTEAALRDLFRAKATTEGADSVQICVGVVYSRKALRNPAHFVPSTAQNQQKKAAGLVAHHRATGYYDSVEYALPAQLNGDIRRFVVSWEAGSAVPLALLTVQQIVECVVCMSPYSNTEGHACAKKCGIFTCWDCLLRSYQAAGKPGAIQGSCNKDGDLLCTGVKCRCPITVDQWSREIPTPAVLKAQQDLKVQAVVAKEIPKALETQKRQLEAEYARIEEIKDADEKAAAKLRLKIVNDVLTLRCPRCKTAFIDFSGCFALTCGNNQCGCGFCAWCLKDCGGDAHRHVPSCAEGNRSVFGDFDSFLNHHKKKRAGAARALIQREQLNANATQKLKELIFRDLADLKISLSEVFPKVAGARAPHPAQPPAAPHAAVRQPARAVLVQAAAAPLRWGNFFGAAPAAHDVYADYQFDSDED